MVKFTIWFIGAVLIAVINDKYSPYETLLATLFMFEVLWTGLILWIGDKSEEY